MSKVVNNEMSANSLADNKIQAKKPEVGDVWEYYDEILKQNIKMYVLTVYDYHCMIIINDSEVGNLSRKVVIPFWFNEFNELKLEYLGKSKCNIEDLFKTENE